MAPFLRAAGVPSSVAPESHAVAGDAEKIAAVSLFQKSSLQMALWLARDTDAAARDSWSATELLARMCRWTQGREPRRWIELGSPASRATILGNLEAPEILERDSRKGRHLRLAQARKRLAELLPKDARDPHLPRRLEEWGEAWPVSRAAIERYLCTYWTKLRNRVSACGPSTASGGRRPAGKESSSGA